MSTNQWTDPPLQLDLRNPMAAVLAAKIASKLRTLVAPEKVNFITDDTVEMILANVLEQSNRPLQYSRTRARYKRTGSKPFDLENVRETVDAMAKHGQLVLYAGMAPRGDKPGLQSTLGPTQDLLNQLNPPLRAGNELREVILLRDVVDPNDARPWNKPEVAYPDTDKTRAMRAALLSYNAMMQGYDVRDSSGARHTTQLVRIFSRRSFEKGGRFYRASYQGLPAADRARLTIDGSPVIEKDYSAFHPRLLYNCRGFEAPEKPYEIEGFDPSIMKPAWNMAINAEDEDQAAHALANKHLRGNVDRARDYIAAAVARHPTIREKFFTGFGLILQRLDSDMAAELLREFVAARKPVLVMHDSFIVKTEDEGMLLTAMNRVYRMATKERFDAKIK